ncbi:KGG domain-containing protein [Comamonas endophytica]|uniref:Stress-induced protein n=1 Tax=Comamonas endophytica TaxID=2949090 RepID=A0ABY6GEC4_9BURK|nr:MULTISPECIES: KGG domain-containing protein [unclassified Acidovorax]MCD2512999.1 stress-induced protein [Acidovorax sp. D4N7]UYG52660.1 stress-induced protein [Acidovorax sp. 5MLIR]
MANSNQQGGGNQNQSGGSSERGFASMDSDKQREIAAEGGRAAHASGNAHEFTSEEAREAGSKSHGGQGSGGNQGGSGSNQGGSGGNQGGSGGTRGGTSEQHAEAGRQSHKNDQR